MAEVITWRQMAGPNFSGTAAAMDAAGDRLKQGTDLLGQFAADQTKLFQQEKAKLKADNTARALSELSGIKSLDELNAVTPKFTFDSLRSQYGEDIDAGAVAQQAAAQKGIIEQDQLRSVDLANKTRTAQETPIMGQYSESIQAALNKGDVAGAKKLYEESTAKLTDATPLSNLITEYEAAQFDKGLKQTQANQQQTLFDQAQAEYKGRTNFNQELAKSAEEFLLGNSDEIVVDFKNHPNVSEAFNEVVKTKAAVMDQLDITPEQRNQLKIDSVVNAGLVERSQKQIDLEIQKRRETKPTAHPQVVAFYNGLAPDQKAAVNSVNTPAGVVTDYLNKIGIAPSAWWDDNINDNGVNLILDKIQNKLGDKKLDDIDSVVIAAAMQGITKNNDNKIDSGQIDVIANRIKTYSEKNAEYKKNANDEQIFVQDRQEKQRLLASKLFQLENLKLKEAKQARKDKISLSFADMTGRPAQNVNEATGESEALAKLNAEIGSLKNELKLGQD